MGKLRYDYSNKCIDCEKPFQVINGPEINEGKRDSRILRIWVCGEDCPYDFFKSTLNICVLKNDCAPQKGRPRSETPIEGVNLFGLVHNCACKLDFAGLQLHGNPDELCKLLTGLVNDELPLYCNDEEAKADGLLPGDWYIVSKGSIDFEAGSLHQVQA